MDAPTTHDRVAAVVALKTLPEAKSRMSELSPPVRARLARVMALDTLAALASAVHTLLVVSDQPDLPAALDRHHISARVIAEPLVADGGVGDSPVGDEGAGEEGAGEEGAGEEGATDSLNLALAHGADVVANEGPEPAAVLTCVGDLPALRTSSVTRVLAAAQAHSRSFLPDHEGRGTTMVIARGVRLNPLYGTEIRGDRLRRSAERHELSGAARLSPGDLPDARWDVDTLADLSVARQLGLGSATSAMIDPVSGAVGDYLTVSVVRRNETSLTVDNGQRSQSLPLTAYDGDPARLVPGRRLHAVRVADALRCWL